MCLAIPVQILNVSAKQRAKIKNGQEILKVDTSLLPKIKKGDWVFVQAGLVVKKISQKEAKKSLDLFQQIHKCQISDKKGGKR